jgi:hypothetical protein
MGPVEFGSVFFKANLGGSPGGTIDDAKETVYEENAPVRSLPDDLSLRTT